MSAVAKLSRAIVAEILTDPSLDDLIERHGAAWEALVLSYATGSATRKGRAEWEKRHQRLAAAIPEISREDWVRVTDGYVDQEVAEREAAFALGLELGRAQARAGGAR